MVLIPLAVEIAKPFIDGNSIGSSSSTQSMASMAKCVNYHTAIPSYDHVSTLNLAVSERCDHTSLLFRPLLITGTPRSATTYTSKKLQSLGMRIQNNDWFKPHLPHGRVLDIMHLRRLRRVLDIMHLRIISQMLSNGEKYLHVFHQVKEPLASITSMCTEPIGKEKCWKFLERHIIFTSK